MSLIFKVVWVLSQFLSTGVFTQTPTILASSNLKPQPPIMQLEYCDPNGDGKMELNLDEISQEALNYYGLDPNDPEAILICTSVGSYVKLNNPSYEPTVEYICQVAGPLTDIAVNDLGIVYVNTFDAIYRMDPTGCTYNPTFPMYYGELLNSLSFDTGGNMYFGFADNSKVYRYDADGLTDPYIWHNFGQGNAGGDFVMVGGKLYISWDTGLYNRLYEVTVDENYNYVSHINKMNLPEGTYGLASEFGNLYGVTSEWLYKINLETQTFESIIYNTLENGYWYGAAGLHEGMILNATLFSNSSDANNNTNPLPPIWTTTQSGQQTIYVRIENETTGEYVIYPIIITINNLPQLTKPENLIQCSDEDVNTFNLLLVEDELLQNVTESVVVSYHELSEQADSGTDPLPELFQTDVSQKTIFVRVQNSNNECYAVTSFQLIVNSFPELAPLVTKKQERSLNQCYITPSGRGYFMLDEMYEQLVTDCNPNYILKYYSTLSDAQNGYNRIPKLFYSNAGSIYEIFVTVTNDGGCTSISNFFLDGNCVKYTLDISSINFPNFFTPNADGIHDFWNIYGVSEKLQKETVVTIYDRFGKKIFGFKPYNINGWDGTYNGNPMPSSDYWFEVVTSIGARFTGHFSLRR